MATNGVAEAPVAQVAAVEPSAADNFDGMIGWFKVETPNGKSQTVDAFPTDTFLDIRMFLQECSVTCEFTSYHFERNGHEINDYLAIQEYPELLQRPGVDGQLTRITLKMVPDFYDENLARQHVRKFRDLLVHPPVAKGSAAVLVGGNQEDNKRMQSKVEEREEPKNLDVIKVIGGSQENLVEFTLTDFYDNQFNLTRKSKKSVADCVRNVSYSAWNPAPGNRRLLGDLLYLEVTTLEGNLLHVTASVDGFFVNNTDGVNFDPSPAEASYKSLLLSDMLRGASPLFKSSFNAMLHRKQPAHAFETMPVDSIPRAEWCVNQRDHTFDWNRSEDAIVDTFGMEVRGVQRDWNEEIQTSKKLPQTNLQEMVFQTRTYGKVYGDFVKACLKGAVGVVQGGIMAVNPMEPKRVHVFMYNNVFFSLALDGRQTYVDAGGDASARAVSRLDLRAIEWINHKLEGQEKAEIHTLATCLVDYAGRRVICQGILPGIFHGDEASNHAYGCLGRSEAVKADPKFREALKSLADGLWLKEHKVKSEAQPETDPVDLYTCVETKGMVGSDARMYLMDIFRLTPRDANFAEGSENITKVLRPELVQAFQDMKIREAVAKLEAENRPAPAAADKVEGADSKESKELEPAKPKKTVEELEAAARAAIEQVQADFRFNVDVLSKDGDLVAESEEEVAKDVEVTEAYSGFLADKIIPAVVNSMKAYKYVPDDGVSLCDYLHRNGVNLRYLGRIASECASARLFYVVSICMTEMIVRAAKPLLEELLVGVRPAKGVPKDHWFLAPCIAKFFTSLLGPQSGGNGLDEDDLKAASQVLALAEASKAKAFNSKFDNLFMEHLFPEPDAKAPTGRITQNTDVVIKSKKQDKKSNKTKSGKSVRLANGHKAPSDLLAAVNVWQYVRESVKRKFDYDLPAKNEFDERTKLSILRRLCQKTGVQVACQAYDFSAEQPFVAEDIVNVIPLVKELPLTSSLLERNMQMGAQTLASGNIRQAVVVFNDCSNIAVQMFGVFHKSAAECSRQLAKCAYLLQDLDGAVEFEQRALLIYQRLTGLDSALTAQSHAKLALYLNAAKHPRVCLKHLRRALFLFELISGPNHPSTCNVYSNMGTILQELGKLDVALKYHKEALARTEMVYGDQAAQTGIAHHSVGMCYALNRDLRYASMHMQQSSTILKAKMGENHMYTIRSKLLLGEFLKILKSKGGGMEKQIDALQSNLFRSLSSSSWAGRDKKMKFQSRLTVDDVLQQAYSTPKQVDSKPALSKKARKRAAQKAKKVAAKAEEATVANGDGDGAEAKTDSQQS